MSGITKRIGLGSGVIAMVLALAGSAYVGSQSASAQGPGGPGRFGGPGGRGFGPGGPGAVGQMMLGRLDLSDAQKEQVKQILDSHQEEQKALREREIAARNALDTVSTSGTFDEGGIRARAAELAIVESDMSVAHARIYNEVFQILTADQQTQLKALQAEMRDRAGKMDRGQGGRGRKP